jgi:hypothetical protein
MWPQALAEIRTALQDGGVVSELGACSLLDLISAIGESWAFIKVPIEAGDEYPRFAKAWYPPLLGDAAAAESALFGGFLGIRGSGRFGFGSLSPQQWEAASKRPGRLTPEQSIELARGGDWFFQWAESLLDVMANADGVRALVLTPHWIELFEDQETYEGATRPPGEEPPPDENALDVHGILTAAVERRATDLLASVGAPLLVRVEGQLASLDDSPLTPRQVSSLLRAVMTDTQLTEYERGGLVFSFGVKGLGRFRVAAVMQRGAPLACIRLLPADPPALQELELAGTAPGLILLGGPAGSGRTTAVASIVRAHLAQHCSFVLTIEEPIEYVHPPGLGACAQLEVGSDVPTFEKAMAIARRSAADLVVLDQVDDPQRLAAARGLVAAGKRVLSTVTGSPQITGATIVSVKRR